MKILVDPVYTTVPSRCSTSYLCWETLKKIFAQRKDAFAYVLYPESVAEDADELAWVAEQGLQDRVTIIPFPLNQYNRMEEMYKFSTAMRALLVTPNAQVWDTEVVLTSRILQIPMMRVSCGRQLPGLGMTHRAARGIFGFEEMPVYSFSKHVFWGDSLDPVTLGAYLLSDQIFISSLWAKKKVRQVARQWLSPSKVALLDSRMTEGTPIELKRLTPKPEKKGDVLTVAFTGRTNAVRRFKDVVRLFALQFAQAKKNLRLVVSTNSTAFSPQKLPEDMSFIEIQRNTREEFYQFLRDEADLVVTMSDTEDFSLSSYEPLLFGVPLIVKRAPWSEFLGTSYPFLVDTLREAYAFINLFMKDYGKAYAMFVDWAESYWAGLVESQQGKVTSTLAANAICEYSDRLHDSVRKTGAGGAYRTYLTEEFGDRDGEVNVLQHMIDNGRFPTTDWEVMSAARMPNYIMIKLLMNELGWEDTNKCGVLVR